MNNIPTEMHNAVLESFWSMLQECEIRADSENDAILKHLVKQWYDQWNVIVGADLLPIWTVREVIANDRLHNTQ